MLEIRKLLSVMTAVVVATAAPIGAAQDSTLRAVRGTVGYQVTKDAAFSRVFGSFLVGDDQFAVTRAASNGLLVLPDSSEVALGNSTTIQVGEISQAAADAPKALTLVAGAVRFTIKHPAGGQANYRFLTSTSQLAVRGTTGLYATGPNGDVVTCLDCAAGDVTVTAGGNTLPLLTGQTAFISVAGIVTVAATTAVVATTFTTTGLSTIASSTTPFTAGIATTAAAGAAGTTAAAVGIGAAASAGIAVGATSHSNSVSTTPAAQPTQSGSGIISSHAIAPAAPLVPTATRTAAPSSVKH